MPELPRNLSGFEVIKALSRAGFTPKRQKGSHVVLVRISGGLKTGCVVPLHQELKIGILKSILRQARIGTDEFRKLL